MAEGGRDGSMQIGDGRISNTVEVKGFSKNTSQELMEIYFENSRRSGGGDVEEVTIRDEVAYVTFMEAEVAQRVASRSNHQVDGHTLTVTLFHPLPQKPCYQNRVLIQGLNNAITEELLRNFLERKTKAQVTEFLYGEEDGNVVVTFSDNIDIAQLGKIFQEISIQGVFLKVERVEISNCIVVQNIIPSSSHDAILYYFENKRSGGGDVERVEMKTEERYCLIYYEDPSVIDRVLCQSHNVDGVDLEIHLHHECLGRRSSRNKSELYLRMSSPGNKDNATLEHTDNQAKYKTSGSVSSNPENESDFVDVKEGQEHDGKTSHENTDHHTKYETSSSVSCTSENESDFIEVNEWQEHDDNATLENTDNQAKYKTPISVSSTSENESDFIEVQEWRKDDDNTSFENTDNKGAYKTSSSVSSNPENESDFVDVHEGQEQDELQNVSEEAKREKTNTTGAGRGQFPKQSNENNVKADSTKPREAGKEHRGQKLMSTDKTSLLRFPNTEIKTKVTIGSLCETKADVLVNTVTQSLDLGLGAVSKEIMKLAGKGIQDELKSNYPNGIKSLEIALTEPHELVGVKKVFHVAVDELKPNIIKQIKILKDLSCKCLQLADELKMSSIAFPALGTGGRDYPFRDVAWAMFEAVSDFQRMRRNHLKKVKFVLYKTDDKTKRAFSNEKIWRKEKRESSRTRKSIGKVTSVADNMSSPDFPNSHFIKDYSWSGRKIDPEVLIGRITKQKRPIFKIVIESEYPVPSFAVNVFIKVQTGHEGCSIRYADVSKGDWNDSYLIETTNETDMLEKGIKTCLSHSTTDRVTHLLFHMCQESRMSANDQVQCITNIILQGGQRYLQSVTICVPSQSEFENIKWRIQENKNSKTFFQSLISLVGFVSPQIIWTSSCLPVTPIVLCSNTEDNLQGDKEAIIKTLKMQMTPKAVEIDSCIEYSGGTNNEELTEINPKGKFAEIMKRSIAETDCATFSRMGQLENLHKSLKGDNSLSASEDIKKKRECSSKIKRKAVDNVSEVKYKMFRFFFSDLSVSFFKNVCVRFSEDEGCIYVEGKNQKTVDEITDIITNAFKEMDTFQESVVHIKKHKQEYAKQLVLEMNSSSPKGNVFCYLDDPFDIHIFARTMNEVQAAKHKINLKLGDIIIKGRQKILFNTFNDNDDNKQASSSSSKSLLPNNTRAFMTDEGIKVFVYNCPILRAPVDVIVNAANADLKHTGGVSKVIADAAGREFISESQTYIKENGNLNVGSSCITQGGNLSYAFVIHTVGPDWSKYSKTSEGLQQCKLDLWKAVIGSFFKAELLQVQSIALPAVSSGMYGVPMEICASQYLSAVLKYSSSTQGQGSLKEIHFIDVNKEILYLIQLVFSASLENNKAAAEEFDRRLQRVISNFGCHSNPQTLKSISSMKKTSISSERFEPHYVLKEQKGRFHFSKVFKVLIYTGDITDSTCQAIVSSEDKDLMLQGGVAKAIRSKAGQTFDQYLASNRGRHLQVGDVIEVDGANLKRKVICCIIPEWSNKMSAEDYEKELRQCFRNILEKVKTYKSVALPLFGTGEKDNNFAIYGRVLLHCLLQFSNAIRQTEALMEVHIVSHDEGSIVCVTSIFTEYFDSEKMLDAESTKATYKGVSSTTFSKEQGQPPLNSSLESRNTIKGRKSGEHTKARVEADMGITENLTSSKTGSDQPLESQKIARDDDSQDNCVICFVNFDDPVKMNKCGHLFCKSCIDSQLQYKPICPVCGTAYGIITGNQPKGTMTDRVDKYANLEGYEGCGVIQITYNMPSGVQGEEHPKPGHPYHGLYRSAYLPNNKKGQKVLHLLHLAFDRRLIFTIGRSVTSGKEDMVTWNDIHHKTSKFGGPQKYGYPDPTYLDRVLEELAAKGVTEESEQQDPGTFIAYERVTLETRF